MRQRIAVVIAGVCVIVAPAAAVAQVVRAAASDVPPATARIFVSVGGGAHITTSDFSDAATFRRNAEDARFDSTYPVRPGPVFAVSGGVLLSPRVGVSAGIRRMSHATPAQLSGRIPHPFFFDRPRTLAGSESALSRGESAIDIQLSGIIPIGQRLQLVVSGGPSFVRVRQDLVTGVKYGEQYPYDTVEYEGADTASVSQSGIGLTIGADLAYYFASRLGVGFGASVTRAEIGLTHETRAVEFAAGGVQIGGGVRIRF